VADAHFAGFVLCDFVLGVLFATLALAIGAASLGNVDLFVSKYVSLFYVDQDEDDDTAGLLQFVLGDHCHSTFHFSLLPWFEVEVQ
jgi:hypothetical protein